MLNLLYPEIVHLFPDKSKLREVLGENIYKHTFLVIELIKKNEGWLKVKNCLILPTGQWYALLHGIAWYAWYWMVFHRIAWCCMVMPGIARYCMALQNFGSVFWRSNFWYLQGVFFYCSSQKILSTKKKYQNRDYGTCVFVHLYLVDAGLNLAVA